MPKSYICILIQNYEKKIEDVFNIYHQHLQDKAMKRLTSDRDDTNMNNPKTFKKQRFLIRLLIY